MNSGDDGDGTDASCNSYRNGDGAMSAIAADPGEEVDDASATAPSAALALAVATKTIQIRLYGANLPKRRRGIRSVVPSTFCAVTSLALAPPSQGGGGGGGVDHLRPVVLGVANDDSDNDGDGDGDDMGPPLTGSLQDRRNGRTVSSVSTGHLWGQTEVVTSQNPQWTACIYREWVEGSQLYFYVHVLSADEGKGNDDFESSGSIRDEGSDREGGSLRSTSHAAPGSRRGRRRPSLINFEASLGTVAMEVSDILGTDHGTRAKRLRRGGCVYCRVEVAKTPLHYMCRIGVAARLFKSSPKTHLFVEISKAATSSASKNQSVTSTWLVVYRGDSAPIVAGSTPPLQATWDAIELDLGTLCNGDLDKPVRVSVQRKGRGGPAAASALVGFAETTLRHLLRLSDPTQVTDADLPDDVLRPNELFLQSGASSQLQRVGKLIVLQAGVSRGSQDDGLGDESHGTGWTNGSPTGHPQGATRPVDLAELHPASPPMATAFPIPHSPTGASNPVLLPGKSFHDYIRQGLVLNLCVAIDFTSSNGAPNLEQSLHYQSNASYNDYEEAILAVCSAVDPYSTKEHSVWGFGAKFPPDPVVRHLFQCGPRPSVVGTQGVLEAYKSVFQSDFIMSGPTVLLRVLQAAANQAKAQHVHMANTLPTPDLRYTVLLIVTDGNADEFEETHRKLNVYGTVPLSVVIVGVGRSADYARMHHLCSVSAPGVRPIATFVEFRSHQHDPTSLGRSALQHIPSQVCEYMARRGF